MFLKSLIFSIIVLIAIILGGVSLTLSTRSSWDREKNSPFECGFDPFKNARIPFSLHFFLLTMIFLIFDLEIILLFPLPFFMNFMNPHSIFIFLFFFYILLLGVFHEWNEGSLSWA